jgi:hypothetical protein
MLFRPLNFLILASIVFWTTGAAQFVHEQVEHGHGQESAQADSGSSRRDKQPQRDEHDDCPTCQLLAHISAAGVAPPPVLLCFHPPCFISLQVTDRLPPTVESRPFAPIRGPPAA